MMNTGKEVLTRRLTLVLSALFLCSCSFFGGDEVDLDAPAELIEFESKLDIDRQWRHSVGKGPGEIHPVSLPAIDGNRLYTADRTGVVHAIDIETGRSVWEQNMGDIYITGATGASNGLVLFGTGKGEVIALDQENGEQRWRVSVSSEVLAPPATNGEVVVVLSLDGKVFGLDATDGSQLWLVDNSLPLLTVRGNAAPVVVEDLQMGNGPRIDVVFVGHDNGKLTAYSISDGVQLWEARIGVPEGSTDLERMVDVDGKPFYFNGSVYAVAFQGGLMSIQPSTGRAAWYQEASSNNAAAGYGGTLVITEANGQVRAFNASEGTELWSTDEYANRSLNTPAVSNAFVAFADFEGYLHFLSRRGGETIGRVRVDGSGVRSPTILHNDRIIVLDNSGTISAYAVTEAE